MTNQPEEVDDKSTAKTAQARLRDELLTSGLSDWVSLAEVQTIISHFRLADTPDKRQDLVLKTIRSVVEDGLMQIGDLPGADGKFLAWPGSVDAAMQRLYDRFVRHYDDPTTWDYSIWLGLTEAGKHTAESLKESKAK